MIPWIWKLYRLCTNTRCILDILRPLGVWIYAVESIFKWQKSVKLSNSDWRNVFRLLSATRVVFLLRRAQKGRCLNITLAKLPAKSNRYTRYRLGSVHHPNLILRLYTRHIAVHAYFCQRHFWLFVWNNLILGKYSSGNFESLIGYSRQLLDNIGELDSPQRLLSWRDLPHSLWATWQDQNK